MPKCRIKFWLLPYKNSEKSIGMQPGTMGTLDTISWKGMLTGLQGLHPLIQIPVMRKIMLGNRAFIPGIKTPLGIVHVRPLDSLKYENIALEKVKDKIKGILLSKQITDIRFLERMIDQYISDRFYAFSYFNSLSSVFSEPTSGEMEKYYNSINGNVKQAGQFSQLSQDKLGFLKSQLLFSKAIEPYMLWLKGLYINYKKLEGETNNGHLQ